MEATNTGEATLLHWDQKKKHCGDCNQSTSSHTRGKSRLLEDMWRFQHSRGRGVPSEADQTDSHMGKKGDVSGITVC